MTCVMKSLDKSSVALIVPAQYGPMANDFFICAPTMLHPAPLYGHIMIMADGANSLASW